MRTILILLLASSSCLAQRPDILSVPSSGIEHFYYQHNLNNNYLDIPISTEYLKKKGSVMIQVNPRSKTEYGDWSEKFIFNPDSLNDKNVFNKVELERIDSSHFQFNVRVSYFDRKKKILKTSEFKYDLISSILRLENFNNQDTISIRRSSINLVIDTRFLFGIGCLSDDSKIKVSMNGEYLHERMIHSGRPFLTFISQSKGLYKLEFEEFQKTYFVHVE